MVARIPVETFDEVAEEFAARARRIVWCNAATVDAEGRPRSRILHPIWEGEGRVGWITTRRYSPKARDLARTPYISLAYVADIAKPAYAECHAAWEDDPAERRRVWELIAATPEPVGFDPAPIYGSPEDAAFGLLRVTPWRVEVMTIPDDARIWQARES